MKFTIELLRPHDVPAAQQLVEIAGWNQLPNDWLRLLHREPDSCFKATADGQLLGTVTTICYGTALAWIGMMLVHPQARRQGIGKQLMQAAIDCLQSRGMRAIGLDATPAGRPLYEQLGFSVAAQWQRWKRTAAGTTEPASIAAAERWNLSESLDSSLSQLDTPAFGVERWSWIKSLAQTSTVAAWPITAEHQGYGVLRPGRIANYLGPVVATDRVAAEVLSQQLLAQATGDCMWDVPPANPAAEELAIHLGFQPVRELYRMWLGRPGPSGQPAQVFALSDPATG